MWLQKPNYGAFLVLVVGTLLWISRVFGTEQDGHSVAVKCPGLNFNGELSCRNQSGHQSACEDLEDPGTIATYKCKKYFEPYYESTTGPITGTGSMDKGLMKCGQDGVWIGLQQFQQWRCKEVCGHRPGGLQPFITHGFFANATAWPWHVAVFTRHGKDFRYICGGTLVRKSAVLLAAHCVDGQSLDSIRVVLGALSSDFKENLVTSHAQIFNINNSFIGDSYDPRKDFQGDIAILELSKHVKYTDHVSPACLPPNAALQDINGFQNEKHGDVVGFGYTETGSRETSKRLKQGRVEIYSYADCFVKLRQTLSETQFCAGGRSKNGTVTVCNGDSGGGLFIRSTFDQKFYLHGIVSTGDSNINTGQCHNYGVFTRVASFMPWIRKVFTSLGESLDEPLGVEVGAELFQHGNASKVSFLKFKPLSVPPTSTVRALSLAFLRIEPRDLLTSLEALRTVEQIRMSHVIFTKALPDSFQPVKLPRLKSFHLDLLHPELERVSGKSHRFPKQSKFQQLLRSIKFFEKDLDPHLDLATTRDVTRIATSGVSVFVRVAIFNLIQVDHGTGTVVLSQVEFAPQILSNVLHSSFRLRHLSLSSCPFPDQVLLNTTELRTLVLDEVSSTRLDLNALLRGGATSLETLVIVSNRDSVGLSLSGGILPASLRHLVLTRVTFDPTETPSLLTTLFCDECLPTAFSLKRLHVQFPHLRELVLISAEAPSQAQEVLKNFIHLELAMFIASRGDHTHGLKLVNVNGTWTEVDPSPLQDWILETRHLTFVKNQLALFWSSEVDFLCGGRVSAVERSAFESGTYKFKGELDQAYVDAKLFSLETNGVSSIPLPIQDVLQVVELENVVVTVAVMERSFKACPHLRVLRLRNTHFPDMFFLPPQGFSLPQLQELHIQTSFPKFFHFYGFHGLSAVVDFGFVLLFFPDEKGNAEFKVTTSLLRSRLNIINMDMGPCVLVNWNKHKGILTSRSGFTNDWLRNGSGGSSPIKKLTLSYIRLNPQVIPSSVTHLNLNFIRLKNTSALLEQPTGLKDLRFVNVRLGTNGGNLVSWEWAELDISVLARFHSNSLTYLALDRANLTNYEQSVRFKFLTFAYIESCNFEDKFATNFLSTFPNLKKLILLGHLSDKILWEILRTETNHQVEWVLTRSTWNQSPDLTSFLRSLGVDGTENGFLILRRLGGSWVKGKVGWSEEQLKLQLLRLKGTAEFGTDARCHGYNLEKHGSPGLWGPKGVSSRTPVFSLRDIKSYLPPWLASILGKQFDLDDI